MSESFNPYASPQAAPEPPLKATEAAPPFVSLRGKALFVLAALGVGMALDVAGSGFSALTLGALSRAAAGEPVSDAQAALIDGGAVLVGLTQMIVYFAGAIGFLMWTHRAHKNLRALGASELDFTPGWAVGWYFVPFMNLFKPYQAMREIWRESDSRFPPQTPRPAKEAAIPALLSLWWGFWILGNIASQVTLRTGLGAETIEMLQASEAANIVSGIFSLAAAICLCRIVWRITNFQESRAAPAAQGYAPAFGTM